MTTSALRIVSSLAPSSWAVRSVVRKLWAFNNRALKVERQRRVAVTLRGWLGRVHGGSVGFVVGSDFFLDVLHVDESLRGRGYGAALLDETERLAANRGCARVVVDTFDFQAPGFYQKMGYAQIGRIDDFYMGYGRTWFRKELRGNA